MMIKTKRSLDQTEGRRWARLKAELVRAFAAPESEYRSLDAETVIARNARK
jgi:hypothetical protein